MNLVLGMGLVMVVGLAGGWVASRLGLPSLTGYLVFGLLLGPHVGGALSGSLIAQVKDPLSIVAVSVIAFMLGGDLPLKLIRRSGVRMAAFATVDSVWTFMLVWLGLAYFARLPLTISLPLAALASSPAPTVLVPIVKEINSKGAFTSMLLMISAMEDITCVILISFAVAVSRPLLDGSVVTSSAMFAAVAEIGGSLMLGAVLGLVGTWLIRVAKAPRQQVLVVLTLILVAAGLTTKLHLSALVTLLTAGFVVTNMMESPAALFAEVESFSSPLMLCFFTVAGATLKPSLLLVAGFAAVVYVLVRAFAKFSGVRIASNLVGISRHKPIDVAQCLLSQAGTTLGLTMLVAQQLPEVSDYILTVMLSAILVFEVIGPPLARATLFRVGDALPNSVSVSHSEDGDVL